MHLNASPRNRPGLRPLALVLMITTTLLPHLGRAEPAATTPPDFPDEVHVMNGCFVSSTACIAKFLAAFPGERAEPLTVRPVNYEGPHTVALLSWHGQWWGRDEYFGVFALHCAVRSGPVPLQIGRVAQVALEQHSTSRVSAGEIDFDAARRSVPAQQRAAEVATAASLLPFATEQFIVESEGQKLAFLLFHPAKGEIAVYDPATGTSQAQCACTDGARVVAHVAARIGYKVTSVQRETAAFSAILVATVESSHGGLAR
jgi:hypothetical protein